MKIVVLDGYALNPGDLSWAGLRAIGELEVHDRTRQEDVIARAAGAEAIFTNKTPVGADAIQGLSDLRFIGVLATGYNIVDVEAARKRGVVVSNIPTYGTDSVAQFAIALLLELCHHVGLHSELTRAGAWTRNAEWSFSKTPLLELAGKTIGIIGFGRIGRRTAEIAHALGMKVVANDARMSDPPEYSEFRWTSRDELFELADVVSLHCPLLADTQGLMDAKALRRMKRTAFLINTSRGPLVIDQDLADALNEERIAGAGLDVLSLEPPPADNPLLGARNCIVTPHIAWATKEARARLMEIAVENLAAFMAGRPVNVV